MELYRKISFKFCLRQKQVLELNIIKCLKHKDDYTSNGWIKTWVILFLQKIVLPNDYTSNGWIIG